MQGFWLLVVVRGTRYCASLQSKESQYQPGKTSAKGNVFQTSSHSSAALIYPQSLGKYEDIGYRQRWQGARAGLEAAAIHPCFGDFLRPRQWGDFLASHLRDGRSQKC